MHINGSPEAENFPCSIYLESGTQKKNDKNSLKPVPKPFKPGIEIDKGEYRGHPISSLSIKKR